MEFKVLSDERIPLSISEYEMLRCECIGSKKIRYNRIAVSDSVEVLEFSNGVSFAKERTCHMEYRKSGPFFDVYYFDCCDKEYSESRCVDGQSEISGEVCPYCGAKVVE